MGHLDLDALRKNLQIVVNPALGERFEVQRHFNDGGITGYLVRKHWRGVAMADRQHELMDYLQSQFGDLAGDISLIFTMTPEEYEAWAEDQVAPVGVT